MKTFVKYLEENQVTEREIVLLNEGLQQEWTSELERFNDEMTNEGLFGSIIGGLTGFALGKSMGKMIAKVLGIDKGVLYDLLTSRLVGTALGATIGKRF